MLDAGLDVDVKAIGPKHTTLRVKWVLVSKVVAHQLTKQSDFFQSARELGFRRIEMTDGYDETWSWKLE